MGFVTTSVQPLGLHHQTDIILSTFQDSEEYNHFTISSLRFWHVSYWQNIHSMSMNKPSGKEGKYMDPCEIKLSEKKIILTDNATI
jgi:hypothetical protein